MNAIRSSILVVTLIGLIAATGRAQQQTESPRSDRRSGTKALTAADIRAWNSIRSPTLSPDGATFAYQLAPGEGDATVVIRSTSGGGERRFPVGEATGGGGRAGGGGAIEISGDSRWAMFSQAPAKREADRLRAQRQPVESRVALVDLRTGQKKDLERARRFVFLGDHPTWVALHTYPVGDPGAAAAGAAGAGRAGGNATASIRVDASDLLLYNLTSGEMMSVGNVAEFAADDSGRYLAYAVATRDRTGNGVQLIDLQTNAVRVLDADRAMYSRLAWAKGGLALAMLRAAPADSAAGDSTFSLLTFTSFDNGSGGVKKTVLVPQRRRDAQGLALSLDRAPQWSEDRTAVYLGLRPAPKRLGAEGRGFNGQSLARPGAPGMGGSVNQPSLPAASDADLPSLILWHWKDPRLQSQQIVEAERDKHYSYLAEYRLSDDALIRLADDSVREVAIAPHDKFGYATEGAPYQRDASVTGRFYSDVYTIDLRTGARSKRVNKTILYVWGLSAATWTSPSADGTRLLYWGMDANWHLLDMATGQERNLTARLPISFADRASDLNHLVAPPHPIVGWSKDGASVLLSDGWDIWKVAAADGQPVNLTVNGRKDQIHYQRRAWTDVSSAEEAAPGAGIDLTRPLYFVTYGEWTKQFGLARVDADKPGARQLLWDDASYQFAKARKSDVLLYSRQTSVDYPDWYVADPTYTHGTRLTDANPQQKEFAWSAGVRLVDYTIDNGVRLQGTLHLPANYEPGKKYPTVVEIYEKRSQGARTYSAPSDRSLVNVASFTNRGYAVLEPDIVYKINDPGPSALTCVLAALRAAIWTGVVDSAHVGLHGHSWGGYETSYIVTQTKAFAAAIAGAPVTDYVSFYSSIYWNTGYSDSPIFESSQTRMKGNPLDYWSDYLRNSPAFHSKHVTTPLIILADDKDGAVDFHQGLSWYNTLRALGKNVILMEYVGENHGLARPANQRDFTRRAEEFFDHYLRDVPAPDWLENGIPHLEMEEHLKARRAVMSDSASPVRRTP